MQLLPFVKCPKSLRLLHEIVYMHGYLPCPDVYVKCLCDSTEFFLERATKRNEIISVQRPEGRLSLCEAAPPYYSPLATDTFSISGYVPSLAFERAASIRYWGVFPTRAAQTLQVGPSQIRERPAPSPPARALRQR